MEQSLLEILFSGEPGRSYVVDDGVVLGRSEGEGAEVATMTTVFLPQSF